MVEHGPRWAQAALVGRSRTLCPDRAARGDAASEPSEGPVCGAWPDVAAADDPAAVERLRDRWSTVLDEMERRLRAHDPARPDPHTDLAGWSRFGALERARAALDRARDLTALRALAEGEFKSTFTWER